MLKHELKEFWSMYCDTDKLVSNMMELLTKYQHDCTEEGVCEVLNRYFKNKKTLIDMFKMSENYIGNMRICIDVELERGNNPSEIKNFCEEFVNRVNAESVIFKYVDKDGKTLNDYLKVGTGRFKARQLCYGNIHDILLKNAEGRKGFTSGGVTVKSYEEYSNFWNGIYGFRYSPTSSLNESTVNELTRHKINGKFVAGMKTSRAFNRVCSIYNVDKLPNYNKLFAEYADMVSGLKRKMKFYISLNPLDYLTMSFGNSWSSCHTIDKKNQRGMPNSYQGMHCGGVMSYMLDTTSIITYVHSNATEDHEEGKIYRNMFHFSDGTLVQGRIYPQGNDGATDLYRTFRRFMQTELSKLLGLKADDWVKKNGSCGSNVRSYGVHYQDYNHFSECNVSYPKEMPNAYNNVIVIGHERICPYCGKYVSDGEDGGYLNHADCDVINEDDEW